MSILDSSDELKALIRQIYESLWKSDIQRDFEDEIKFLDGRSHQNPRPQEEIDDIQARIEHYASLMTQDTIESLGNVGMFNIRNFYENLEMGNEIAKNLNIKYRMRFGEYVKSQYPSKK